MCNYLDEIKLLEEYAVITYPDVLIRDYDIYGRKERKILSSKHWGAFFVLRKCYNDPVNDPLDIMLDIKNSFEIEYTFAAQDINVEHYKNAEEAVDDMIAFLKKRRNE